MNKTGLDFRGAAVKMVISFVTLGHFPGKHAKFSYWYIKSGIITILAARIKTSKSGRIKQCVCLVPEVMTVPEFVTASMRRQKAIHLLWCLNVTTYPAWLERSEHKVRCISIVSYTTTVQIDFKACDYHFLNVFNFHILYCNWIICQ